MVVREKRVEADFVVVGGGMAGLCAAVAAARNGTKTLIIQDRPMFGGNASSEIRMWICGAHGPNRKETGLLEELQLDNLYFNPELHYTMWDDVMYNFVRQQKNLSMLLNSSVESVEVENGRIRTVTAWNLVEYTRYRVEGKLFADCSGDGILRLSGAKYRMGRESRDEFDEPHAPEQADKKTMGNSILIQLRRTKTHRPFRAPEWAYHYTDETAPKRHLMPEGNNFWWMEFGGVRDTIADAEEIRDELYRIAYGVWEYIKNHPDGRGHEWELDWIGSLPGKRESVRFVGDHTLSQKEVEAGGDGYYHPGRCADIVIDGKKMGVIGQIHPLVAETYGIGGEVYVAELDFTGLQAVLAPERVFHSLPKFPTVSRDLALVCEESMTVGMLEACIKKAGGKLLRSVQLFDIYRGPGIAPGKKSIAFSLELRADDRTLTDEDTTGVMNAVLEKLKNGLGVSLR